MEDAIMSAVPLAPPMPPDAQPRYDHLITEDGKPVDNMLTEAHYRLLVEPLYASWDGPPDAPGQFVASVNVGIFHTDKEPLPPVAPDMLLAVGVEVPQDLLKKENRSYFIWRFGKSPDVVVEIVSETDGGEDTYKLKHYAKIKVPYYVIFDPWQFLKKGALRVLELVRGKYKTLQEPYWLPDIGLGLTLWEGEYEGKTAIWLRWCDQQGNVLLTGKEKADLAQQRADQERQRADQERRRVEQLKAKLRALGVDPDA
jgi:Uma2 family endonuclease